MLFNFVKKSKENTDVTLKSLFNLIEYATDFRFKQIANHKQLHLSLIKNFFNTNSVVLNEETKTIYIGLDCLSRGLEVKIKYTDLTSFLKSCVRYTPENEEFYINILDYYSEEDAVA